MIDSQLIARLLHAEQQLRYWKAQRKSIGTLIAPRTDWMIIKWNYFRDFYMEQVLDSLDIIIPTDQLYAAIYE